MVHIRQDIIHVSVREFLKTKGWNLVAGQYPNGSDNELPTLNVVDPILACDNSPDPRRHSKNKYVPDLVAYKENVMFLIEMDSHYSLKDERKLERLLFQRRNDLLAALRVFVKVRGVEFPAKIEDFVFVPCLGFGYPEDFIPNPDFCYFKVAGLYSVTFEGNQEIQDI